MANKALDRSPRTAFAVGFVRYAAQVPPDMQPDVKLLASISEWTDQYRDCPITAPQIEDLGMRVYDWIGPPRKKRRRAPDPDGRYRRPSPSRRP